MTRFCVLISGAASSILAITDLRAQPSMLAAAPAAIVGQPKLSATFHDPINIELKWKNDHAPVEGHVVEYTSSLAEDFVILSILPREITTFQHPDLAPKTKYFYRIRPYLGEASSIVNATTGKALDSPEPGSFGEGEPILDAPDATTTATKKSLRDSTTSEAATPAHLTTSVPKPLSIALRWVDRANDEDGYLVEASYPGESFQVIAFLPPNSVGFTIPNLPAETDIRFRIRAFFYGCTSNLVERLTGNASKDHD